VPFAPPTDDVTKNVEIYSVKSPGNFQFSNETLPEWQSFFARKLATLAHDQGTQLVLLYLPLHSEVKDSVIRERKYWPEYLGAELTMMGIPPSELFANMTEADILKLYADRVHFNKNGTLYFTKVITPTLIRVYDNKDNP